MISVGLLVCSLLAVVVGHAVLAGGQIRLTQLQTQLAAEQVTHRNMEVSTAELEAPARVVTKAEKSSHLVLPSQITQLPSVPLNVPIAPPRMYAAPAPSPTTTTTPATTTTTAASGGTGTPTTGSSNP
jgi:hypothetical protein